MTDLLKEVSVTEDCRMSGEDALSFLKAVLDVSGGIIAFLDRKRHPILFRKNFSAEQVSLTNAEMSPVHNPAGDLLGYILREKKGRGADRDYLTGTLGRARLEREFAQRNNGCPADSDLTLLFIDLNRFKPINEQYGHLVGDQVLLQFAALLKNTFRSEDCVARYGGDEFVILCDCPPEIVEKRVQQFQKRLAAQYIEVSYPDSEPENERITLGFSYGITRVSGSDSLPSALSRADSKLLAMKKTLAD